jgi:hypothetical protein
MEKFTFGALSSQVFSSSNGVVPAHYGKEFGGTFDYGYWCDDGYQGEGMHPNVACNGFVREGYVMLNFEDAFACNDVIILFPPKKQDKPIIEPRGDGSINYSF